MNSKLTDAKLHFANTRGTKQQKGLQKHTISEITPPKSY